jgi:hypothetical protein
VKYSSKQGPRLRQLATRPLAKPRKGRGREINNQIISLLTSKELTVGARIEATKQFFQTSQELINHVHIITLLQRCSKNRIDVLKIIPLPKICELLQSRLTDVELQAYEVSSLVYSLRLFDESTPGIQVYFDSTLLLLGGCDGPFTAQNIGCCFYGLQQFTSKSIQARALLQLLVAKGKTCVTHDFVLGPQEFSMAIYGLRKMEYCDEVNEALLFLAANLDPNADFSEESSIANSLNGLQNFNAEISSGTRAIMSLLATKILDMSASMSPRALGSAYMGLRSSSISCSEVKFVLSALNTKLNVTTTGFNAVSLSSILNGIRNMGDKSTAEVKVVLKLVANILETSSIDDFDPKSIAVYNFFMITHINDYNAHVYLLPWMFYPFDFRIAYLA